MRDFHWVRTGGRRHRVTITDDPEIDVWLARHNNRMRALGYISVSSAFERETIARISVRLHRHRMGRIST